MTDSSRIIFEHILFNNGESWWILQKKFSQGSVNNFFKTYAEKPIRYKGEDYLLWEDHSFVGKQKKVILYVTLKKELLR